jgi:hypothetical protein
MATTPLIFQNEDRHGVAVFRGVEDAQVGAHTILPIAGYSDASAVFAATGRYAQVKGFTGAWEGIYHGVAQSGSGTLYIYDYDGIYPVFGIYASEPSGVHLQNVREATFSLSGISLLVGVRIDL